MENNKPSSYMSKEIGLSQLLLQQNNNYNVTFNGKPARFLEYNDRLFVDTDDIASFLEPAIN